MTITIIAILHQICGGWYEKRSVDRLRFRPTHGSGVHGPRNAAQNNYTLPLQIFAYCTAQA